MYSNLRKNVSWWIKKNFTEEKSFAMSWGTVGQEIGWEKRQCKGLTDRWLSFWGTGQSRQGSVAWSCHPRSSAQTWQSVSSWRTWWRNLYKVLILAGLVEFSICFRRKHEFENQCAFQKFQLLYPYYGNTCSGHGNVFFCWYWFTELNTSKQTFSLRKVKNRW